MHIWGEKDFDWGGLNKAIDFIETSLVRYGRMNVMQAKEKFGTARIYMGTIGWYQMHSLTHPRSAFSRYPKWLWNFDCDHGPKIMNFLFNWWVIPYHKWLYRTVYWIAVKRWPRLREEILCCADWLELLKGI